MTYLYGVAEGLAAIHDLRGADGEPLRLYSVDGLTVIASDRHASPEISKTTLAAQDTLVRTLHDRSEALLPMRFGAAYASDHDATRAIQQRAPALHEALAHVRGREQMTLRIMGAPAATTAASATTGGPSGPAGSAGIGASYLRSRAQSAVPPHVRLLLRDLEPLVYATRVQPGTVPGLLATVYHLIDRGSSRPYAERVQEVGGGTAGITLRISGPSPAYAFT